VGPTTPASLYWHLHHTHIAPHSPSSCCWSSCTYTSTQSNPLLRTNELSLHVRTHMPSFRAATGHETPSSTDVERSGIVVPLGNRMKYDRYHAQLDAASEITGLGYLACLVLRNVSRTVKIALDNPAGGASVKLLAGGEPSIFESLSAAQEGGTTTDPILQKLEKVDYAPAKRGAEALSALEDRLVSTALEDFGLGKILGEVLLVVTTCRGVTSKA
jgi:chromatin structure-remodeling complex subunit RSC9